MCNFVLVTNLFIAILLTSVPASARPDTTASALPLGEVSVTAIKSGRADASLTPVAATIVGEDEVERLGIVTMKDVS